MSLEMQTLDTIPIYEQSDHDIYQAWAFIEGLYKNIRVLLFDSLSYINQARRDQAIKTILSSYNPLAENNEVFNQDLNTLIEKKNTTNKFITEALRNKRHVSSKRDNTRTVRKTGNKMALYHMQVLDILQYNYILFSGIKAPNVYIVHY
ncbi:15439_t:CDS:2, partial [Cetraspora pellucida]